MINQHALDVNYFKLKLTIVLRNIDSYTPQELAMELSRLANTADVTVVASVMQPDTEALQARIADRTRALEPPNV